PLDLIEDLSRGPSWLSFARSAGGQQMKYAAAASPNPSGQTEKPKNLYSGKTYNSADAIAEFFKKKDIPAGGQANPERPEPRTDVDRPLRGFDKLRAISSESARERRYEIEDESAIVPGSHVRHAKYGKGLVL